MVRLDHEKGTIALVSDDAVDAAILRHMEKVLIVIQRDFDCAAVNDIQHVRRFIVQMAPGIDQATVLPIATKSQKGWAYERLDFDLTSSACSPTWESILVRCSNANAIKAFIGSLFHPEADRAQFVYLYGAGNEGKGSMIEALSTVFGSAHINQITPKELRFWAASVYNKRLVTFSECDDFRFAVSEDVKAITGNDTISVDEKGHPIFKAKTICKFMFAANVKPRAQDTPAHRRRLIYSEIKPWTGEAVPVRIFVSRLVEEIQGFLSECWRTYKTLCPNGGPIPVEEKIFRSLIADNNAEFQEILDEYFVVHKRFVSRKRDIEGVFLENKIPVALKMPFFKFLETKGIRYRSRKTGEKGDVLAKQVSVMGLWGIAPKANIRPTEQHNTFLEKDKWEELLKILGSDGSLKTNPKGHSGNY